MTTRDLAIAFVTACIYLTIMLLWKRL